MMLSSNLMASSYSVHETDLFSQGVESVLREKDVSRRNGEILRICEPIVPEVTKQKMLRRIRDAPWGSRVRQRLWDRLTDDARSPSTRTRESATFADLRHAIQLLQLWSKHFSFPSHLEQATLRIQRWWRANLFRRTPRSSRCTFVTWFFCCHVYHPLLGPVLFKLLLKCNKAAMIIQRFARTQFLLPVQLDSQVCAEDSLTACSTIQATWKMHVQKRNYHIIRTCAHILPSLTRHSLLWSRQELLLIGSHLKTYMQVCNNAAAIIQNFWRHHQSSIHGSCQFLYIRSCVILLQAQWREYMCRANYSKLSACKSLCRTSTNERLALKLHLRIWGASTRNYIGTVQRIVRIQKWWRMCAQQRN